MELQVTEAAAKWYKDELELEEGESLQFFVRYGGSGGLQPGFSLAIATENKTNPAAETTVLGVTFFVEKEDDWYFDGSNLLVNYDEDRQEPSFDYHQS